MKKWLSIMIVGLALLMLAGSMFARTNFRGVIAGLDTEKELAVINYYGNPDVRPGGALYVHDIYGRLKAELTIVEIQGDTVYASVDNDQFDQIRCGNFVADFPPTGTAPTAGETATPTGGETAGTPSATSELASLAARFIYRVKIKYEHPTNQSYDVQIDKLFEFDNYIDFIGDDGVLYRIDVPSIQEIGVGIEGDTFFLTYIALRDEGATEQERMIYLSTAAEDTMSWGDELLGELRRLEVLIENRIQYTYEHIATIYLDEPLGEVPTAEFIEKYKNDQEDIENAIEDSIANLPEGEGSVQTDQIIRAYPTRFQFDQYKRVIPVLQTRINTLIAEPVPDVEEIQRLVEILHSIRDIDETMIARVLIQIDEPEPQPPVELDKKEGYWEAVINLTAGTYKYHFIVEIRSEPCNEMVGMPDPLSADSTIEIVGPVVPVEISTD